MNDDPEWFKPKSIIHFDRKCSCERVLEYVSNPKNIEKHSFYPFIHFGLIKSKYKREKSDDNKKGKLVPELKKRNISYASHLDGHIFSFYTYKLREEYEALLEKEGCNESVIAYRKLEKSNVDFACDAFKKLKELCETNEQSNFISICYDIKGFYDNLDHKILKEQLCDVLKVAKLPLDYFKIYKALTTFSWVDKENLLSTLGLNKRRLRSIHCYCENGEEFRNKIRGNNLIKKNDEKFGIPQGSSISPLFSNIYMLPFDREMTKYAKEIGAFYQRYSDDILWICEQSHFVVSQQKIQEEISKLLLKINEEKTKESLFKYSNNKIENLPLKDNKITPLEYLGLMFNGESCFIKNQTLSRYYVKLTNFIKRSKRFAAYSKKDNGKIYLRKLYNRFSHLCKEKDKKTNFILYARNARRKLEEEGLKSGISHQIKNHWKFIHQQLRGNKIMEVEVIGVTRTFGKNKEGKETDFVKLFILQTIKGSKRKELQEEGVGQKAEDVYVDISLYDKLKELTYPCHLRLTTETDFSHGNMVQKITSFEEIK